MTSEAWIDFAAGWISGGISVLVIQPIDTVLTRLQASTMITSKVSQNELTPPSTAQKSFSPKGAAAATVPLRPGAVIRSMIENFGVSSLWRGSSAMIAAVPIQNALLMTGYGVGKRWSGTEADASGTSKEVLFGIFVGGCTGQYANVNNYFRCMIEC